ncbi:MAG: Ig-like domain-containing protein [Bacteroidetes bacterium]|nr:Ig-like domain-containing protein [Bacteroidota bacterium]
MGLNKKSAFFANILLVLAFTAFIFGCASIQKPQGGPRDRTPPKLLKATPPNMTRNFSAKQIRLDFDEYFNLKVAEISISPAQEKVPLYKKVKKSIVVQFKDSLQKNTTYVINFGKGIADVNEGNILENFTYVFSTGPHIDSLSVSGSVQDLVTGEKQKDVTVMLLTPKQDTSLWGKKKPTIYATTDTSGNFSLNNLHPGDYYIYALKEASPNKIYDNENELVAFKKRPIHLQKDTSHVELTLFKQEPEKLRVIEHRFDVDGKMIFSFNKSLQKPSVKILSPAGFDDQKLVEFSPKKDTALVYMKNMDFDSLQVSFLQNNKPLDTLIMRKGRREAFTRNLTIQTNVGQSGLLKPTESLLITTSLPLASFDQSLITFNEDSTNIANYNLRQDTGNARRLVLKYPWKQGSRYQVVFNEGALTDIYGDKNKKIIRPFLADKLDNYGQLTVKVKVPDTSKSYIVQLLNEKKEVVKSDLISRNATLVYKNYPVGKYWISVVYDDNRNGKWDTGNVKRKEYPENIWQYNKQISLRANWEAEEDIDVPKEVINP